MENRDTSFKHFTISIVKRIFRLVGSALIICVGYHMQKEAPYYPDLYNAGYILMFAGGTFFVAEILGILEEL